MGMPFFWLIQWIIPNWSKYSISLMQMQNPMLPLSSPTQWFATLSSMVHYVSGYIYRVYGLKSTAFQHTSLLQRDDHGARAEGVPGRAVVGGQEVGLHHVVDGEGREDAAALSWRLALLHRVPLQQRPLLLLPHVLLPRPHLRRARTHRQEAILGYIAITSDLLVFCIFSQDVTLVMVWKQLKEHLHIIWHCILLVKPSWTSLLGGHNADWLRYKHTRPLN